MSTGHSPEGGRMKKHIQRLTSLVALLTMFVGLSRAATFVVTNTNDAGLDSLRNAIIAANADCLAADTIAFNIPGAGPHTITLSSQLPAVLCDNITIDGYTQPGSAPNSDSGGSNNADLRIVLDGSSCGACSGLSFQGTGGTVKGLVIHSFANSGLEILVAGLSFPINVYGNYIGVDPGGMTAAPNNKGIHVAQGLLELGSGLDADRNFISGNTLAGISTSTVGSVNAFNNQIGGRRDGSGGMGNGMHGFALAFNTAGNRISGNFIRYNSGAGIAFIGGGTLWIDFNRIHGNSGAAGIDLGADGITPNDEAGLPYDSDTGPNSLVNHPVITSVKHVGADTIITGTLKAAPMNQPVVIEFFSNGTMPTNREGEYPFHSVSGTLDANGFFSFNEVIPGFLASNVSATAKVNECGGAGCDVSSEFSLAVAAVVVSPPEVTVSFAPTTISQGGNSTLTFTLQNTNAAPITNVTFTNTYPAGLVNGTGGASGTCGGTVGAAPGSNTFQAVSGINIPGGGTCTLTVDVTSSLASTYTVTVNAGEMSSADSGSNTMTSSGSLIVNPVVMPPVVFIVAPTTVAAGGTMLLAINVQNPGSNTVALGSFNSILTYPSTFVNAAPAGGNPMAGCSATLAGGAAGGNTIGFSGGSVATSTTCAMVTVEVVAPTVLGPYTFTIPAGGFTMSSPTPYSNPSPISVTVNVTSGAAPSATLVPPVLTFPTTQAGTRSADQMLTFSNTGTVPVTISGVFSSGPFAFSAGTTCAAATPVPPAGNCVILVAFAPVSPGPTGGSIVIVSDAGSLTATMSGTATAVPTAAVTLDPRALEFGNQPLGVPSEPQRVVLTNTGNDVLSVSRIVTSAPFAVILDTTPRALSAAAKKAMLPGFCPDGSFSLPPAQACYFDVVFTPTRQGTVEGQATVGSNVPPDFVFLRGQSGAARDVSISPQRIDFGSVRFGARSEERVFSVTNTGFERVTIGRVALSPAAAASGAKQTEIADFTLSHDCSVVEPGRSCGGVVTFKPTALGARSADVVIEGDFQGGTRFIALDGDGAASTVPILSFSASGFGFGQSGLGVIRIEDFAISNAAQLAVTIERIYSLGDFVVRHNCPRVLEPGRSCTVTTAFLPTLPGPRQGKLVIESSAEGNPHHIPLEGAGCRMFSLRGTRLGLPTCAQ
jgi:hypothetical protein